MPFYKFTPLILLNSSSSYSSNNRLLLALKKMGVPTEFIVYPNMGHWISDMRYQMVKMQAEFNWFEKWIRGKEGWIDWRKMIETLKERED